VFDHIGQKKTAQHSVSSGREWRISGFAISFLLFLIPFIYSVESADEQNYINQSRQFLETVKRSNPNAYSKVWAHRVNTKEKLEEAKHLFAGIEIDAVFDAVSNKFLIYHPPAENIGFELSDLLRLSADKPEMKLWLDWKNPEVEDYTRAFEELNRLDRLYRIKKRIIVETGSYAIFSGLRNLSENGWMHSYYLPTEEIIACSKSSSTTNCAELSRQILDSAQAIGCGYLSFDHAGASFVLNRRRMFSKYKLLSWNTDVSSTSTINVHDFIKMIEPYDSFLMTFPSRFFH
jgi:hypothetical protein